MKIECIKVLYSLLSLLFVVATINAGYLLMLGIERCDTKVFSRDHSPGHRRVLRVDGVSAERKLEEMAGRSRRAGDTEGEKIYGEALESLRATGGLRLTMLPVSPFLVLCTLGSLALALCLLILSRFTGHETMQTVLGIFGGFMTWVGMENGLVMAARDLGIARRYEIVDGMITGTRGEFLLLQHSWVFLVPVLAYLLFQESVRCNLFLFIRRRLKLMRGPTASGRIDNYAPRVAFFYVSCIWTFYVLLLFAFDERVFGVGSWFTHVLFFLCLSGSGYLFYRLTRERSAGGRLRYSIAVTVVLWSDVEILMKWGRLSGSWLRYDPVFLTVLGAGVAVSAWLIYRSSRRPPGG